MKCDHCKAEVRDARPYQDEEGRLLIVCQLCEGLLDGRLFFQTCSTAESWELRVAEIQTALDGFYDLIELLKPPAKEDSNILKLCKAIYGFRSMIWLNLFIDDQHYQEAQALFRQNVNDFLKDEAGQGGACAETG